MARNTPERLMDAAEVLFAVHGIRNTSVRMIVAEINANVSSIRFHFGSLEGLKRAVLLRRFEPLVAQRLAGLANLQQAAAGAPISTRQILQAWFAPMLDMMTSADPGERSFPVVLAHMLLERAPEYQALLNRELADHLTAFIDLLHAQGRRTHPELSRQRVAMRFDFVIGAFGHALNRVYVPPDQPMSPRARAAIEQVAGELLDFAEAGFGEASAS